MDTAPQARGRTAPITALCRQGDMLVIAVSVLPEDLETVPCSAASPVARRPGGPAEHEIELLVV